MPKEAPPMAIPIAERMPVIDIRGMRGPVLLIKCPCALIGNVRVVFFQAMEIS